MKTLFTEQFEALEQERSQLFKDLAVHSEDILNLKPGADAWSVAEVVEHLVLSEASTLAYMTLKAKDMSRLYVTGDAEQQNFSNLKAAFSSDSKYKAPEGVVPSTNRLVLDDLEVSWAEARKGILALANNLQDEDFGKDLYKHPGIGKMNMMHMIQFLGMHVNRHKLQIERTLKSVQ